MNTRTHIGRPGRIGLTVLTALATALPVALSSPAAAADGPPAFLSPAELPPHSSSPWYAGEVTAGVPDPLPFCYGEVLPGTTSRYREFWTEYDTNARQVTVVERDEAAATALAATLRDAVRGCAERTEQQNPEVEAESRYYGRVRVEEGARVYGVHTNHTVVGSSDVHLFSVGRDGRTVTVVHWGQLGDFRHAPVADFRKTTATAVGKLY
ncbi:hypothetical protein CUT44_23945 [Streptomyces carminius]|uniref:PknH-like extracellular domain-containing protein n=1 Tax=Streptomyces carminius TaxID=2665496 RepID=A0A2M8LTQ5_9ACTN|nr:hypothetical protein [Streptomyces carminius]PJE95343.1 hypothetical protein CUT44_23945 [Streptomyces carminius]